MKNAHLIGTKPGGTAPAIAGTRIRVALIAEICKDIGQGPEAVAEILRMYDHLSREQVQAAIDYWHESPDEIEAEIREEEEILGRLQAEQAGRFTKSH